jgi:hypothetical protein
MVAADIEHIDLAQACLQQAQAESGEGDTWRLASELMYYPDMVSR